MKTRINQSKTGKSLLITFIEGFSTYTITVPMPYAIRFFAEGIQASLETLAQSGELQANLSKRDGEKAEIQERLRKSLQLFEEFLEKTGR